jgi:alpha-L-fucosidase
MSTTASPAQSAWKALGFGLFVHFGINTFHDVEWSDGSLDASAYRPDGFDPASWCAAAKAAGARFLVLTAKHIDGFCNWPSAHGDGYTVRETPFGRDLVGEVAAAARDAGLAFGLYYALWDRRCALYGDDAAYAERVLAHLEELLTRYGPIAELWFDGAWMKFAGGSEAGPQVPDEAALLEAWNREGRPRWHWDRIHATVKRLQPDCVVLNNGTTRFPGVPLGPVDARCGEKATALRGDRTLWTLDGRETYLPLQIEATASRQGPPGFFADGSWFFHPWDHSVASVAQVREWLDQARRLDAVFLLNVGPSSTGRLRPEDEALLHGLRA